MTKNMLRHCVAGLAISMLLASGRSNGRERETTGRSELKTDETSMVQTKVIYWQA